MIIGTPETTFDMKSEGRNSLPSAGLSSFTATLPNAQFSIAHPLGRIELFNCLTFAHDPGLSPCLLPTIEFSGEDFLGIIGLLNVGHAFPV